MRTTSCFRMIKDLPPPISQNLDIKAYSVKLSTYAYFLTCDSVGTIAGVLAFYRNEEAHQLYIPYLVTCDGFQGKGVATGMLKHLSCEFQGKYQTIALEVLKSNVSALHLYQKNNFKIREDRGDKFLMACTL